MYPAAKSSCTYLIATTVICFSLLGAAHAMAAESTKDFAHDTSVGNSFEIQSSQLALEKTQSKDIKLFAQHMIDDHGKAQDDLKSAVSASNADVVMPDGSLDGKHQKMLGKLNDEKGKDFDKLYVHDQVVAHDDTVAMFMNYAQDGDNAALKDFANATLPTLKEHQQDIHKIRSNM